MSKWDKFKIKLSKCKRCGQCCYRRINDKKIKCPNLIKMGVKYFCRHFPSRIGREIGKIDGQRFYCTGRLSLHVNFKGCPFNREEWGEYIDD